MLFKFLYLGMSLFLLALTGCSDNKKEAEYDEFDRMAGEITQPLQHQNIVEDEATLEQNVEVR